MNKKKLLLITLLGISFGGLIASKNESYEEWRQLRQDKIEKKLKLITEFFDNYMVRLNDIISQWAISKQLDPDKLIETINKQQCRIANDLGEMIFKDKDIEELIILMSLDTPFTNCLQSTLTSTLTEELEDIIKFDHRFSFFSECKAPVKNNRPFSLIYKILKPLILSELEKRKNQAKL